MIFRGLARLACVAVVVALAPGALRADEATKTIKIGVVFDLTGPFAGGGSDLQYLGAKIMIDWFNAQGGAEGYKVDAVYADAQSKPDVAINEAVRLIEQEKVDMLLGFYSSAECVPTAARVEQFKKFMWITTCIASPVLEGKNLQYVFRPQPFGQQWGHESTEMVAEYAKAQLGKDPKDLKVAIIHEDGPYGTDVARGDVDGSAKYGFQVVANEGYSASAPDLSSMVTKLKRSRPDVIFHTGYNPDITLFLRQSRELGLKFSTLIGQGAGYTVYSKLKETLGTDVNYVFDTDAMSIWQVKQEALKPGLAEITKMIGEEYVKAKPDTVIKSAHVGIGAANTYVFLSDVLPRAIKKYGGITSDDLRQAALDTDIPEGGTLLGFGVKFETPGMTMAGQNDRGFPAIVQYIDDKSYVVWPKALQQREPVLKLPSTSPYAAN